jgi:hypothetical protein
MTIRHMSNRVDALEQRAGTDLRPLHRIFVDVGRTEAEAVAAYEAEHGSTEGDNLLLWVIVDPPAPVGSY